MPKPASPVIIGLEEFETYRGGPRAGQTWNDELPCLMVNDRGSIGLLCRWELSESDRHAIGWGADIMLTLFVGPRGCPPMYLEAFRKDCDPAAISDQRGVIKTISPGARKYSPEQIAEMRKASLVDEREKERHKARHVFLHHSFDELMADYLSHNRGAMPSNTTLMQLLEWSHKQTIEPER